MRGEAVLLGGKTIEDMMDVIGHMKGKILVMGAFPKPAGDRKAYRENMRKLFGAIQTEGIAAFLVASEKENGFMNMTGSPIAGRFRFFPDAPTAFLNKEHATMLKRMLEKHGKVDLELNLGGTLSEKPVQAFNSIGEIRGSEKPDEVVILGAHLDSWDLGTGATDNGTGSVASLEALRAIQASGVKPKRTIRVVLFSGEEQGIFGSKAYVKAHAGELKAIQAVLIDDLGTGKLRGFAMEGREDLRPFMAEAIAPLNEMGVRELPLESSEDSDHAPFVEAGVPAFFGIQDNEDYFTATHHSQADTFEHVKPEALVEGATAMAVTALGLADMAPRLPHKTVEKIEKIEKTEKNAPAAH
ncbi:MAG: M20/M25/M40 family metallo-hydrolase [Holophagaceae bacterium]|nr:M20/M25/M40 family metallo-hydrolase [Holophagaceae bacterium]